MKSKSVKELMVPLTEYATVSEEATLYEAVSALEKVQKEFDQSLYPHRAVLIFNKKNKIVGKLSQLDILRALEPKYEEMIDAKPLTRFGLNPRFLKSMVAQFDLWNKPMDDICKKAARMEVKNFMYTPGKGEYVDEDASLDEAIHQLVMGHHQSLLVTKNKEIVGVIKLTDIFDEISQAIKTCGI